jgi:hypothetical protein
MTGDAATDCLRCVRARSGSTWRGARGRRRCSPPRPRRARDAALFEGPEETGGCAPRWPRGWGLPRVPVAAGGGDNAAGAVGVGVVRPGEAFALARHLGRALRRGRPLPPQPARAVHAFCHALPGHLAPDVRAALGGELPRVGVAARRRRRARRRCSPSSTPRRPAAGACCSSRTSRASARPTTTPRARRLLRALHDTDAGALGRAVLEGVAFAFADAQDVLRRGGRDDRRGDADRRRRPQSPVGADPRAALGRPLVMRAGGDVGPAVGAARLARLAAPGDARRRLPAAARGRERIEPDPALAAATPPRARFRALYARLRDASSRGRPPDEKRNAPSPTSSSRIRYAGPESEPAGLPLLRPRARRARQAHGGAQLRFAVCFWHTLLLARQRRLRRRTFAALPGRAAGGDAEKLAATRSTPPSSCFEKLGAPFFCFHDRDVAPEGATLRESNALLDRLLERVEPHMARTGVRLLWGTANLFSHPRYAAGAATNPDPEVFAYAAAQVKHCLEATHRLGGANYVLWGGREGYETLLNTDLRRGAGPARPLPDAGGRAQAPDRLRRDAADRAEALRADQAPVRLRRRRRVRLPPALRARARVQAQHRGQPRDARRPRLPARDRLRRGPRDLRLAGRQPRRPAARLGHRPVPERPAASGRWPSARSCAAAASGSGGSTSTPSCAGRASTPSTCSTPTSAAWTRSPAGCWRRGAARGRRARPLRGRALRGLGRRARARGIRAGGLGLEDLEASSSKRGLEPQPRSGGRRCSRTTCGASCSDRVDGPFAAGRRPFRDPAPSRPRDERARDLLARMTREEKIAQLCSVWLTLDPGSGSSRRCRRSARRPATRCARCPRHRPDHPALRQPADRAAGGRARAQRVPAPARRGHAARHPRDRPRGGAHRLHHRGRDAIPLAAQLRRHLGPGADPPRRRRDPPPDPGRAGSTRPWRRWPT